MNEDRQIKKIIKQLRKSVKSHDKQADTLEKKLKEESNPRIPRKKGQPANSKKHSDLYTDENPKGTIHGLGFKDVATAKASVSKIRNSSRSHAHKIQAAVAMEQRAREMGKTSEAAVYRKFINSMKKKTKAMKEEFEHVGKIAKRIGKKTKERSEINKDYFNQYKDDVDAVKKLNNEEKELNEEGLRAWFGKSRSKGGKPGWVQVVSGKPCARQPGQKSTPKCVSSAKRASMSDAERKSAQRRKRKADPNQRFKSGAAKPTYVRTDSKRKMKKEDMHSDWKNEELFLYEVKDKKGKGSGKKDACYHKVKSRYSVWPSAYASGALVKCRKKGAKNWGNSSKKESYDPTESFQQFQEKCWKGYEKKGMKTMFGKRYPNCVKKTKSEEVEVDTSSNINELSDITLQKYEKKAEKQDDKRSAAFARAMNREKKGRATPMIQSWREKKNKSDKGIRTTGRARANQILHQRTQDAYGTTRFDNRAETGDTAKKKKTLTKIYKSKPAVKEEFYRKKYDVKKGGYVKTDKMTKSNKRSGDSKAEYRDVHKDLAKYKIKKLKTEEMGNIAHTKTKKDGKTIINVNKNDELDAQAAMKNDPKYILGKTRVQPYKEGYSANPAQQAAIAIAKKKKKEDDMVARKMKKEDWRSELGYVEEAKKKMVKVKLGDPSKIKVKVTDIGAGGKEYVRKDEMNEAKSPAWQRKAGKNPSGGLNAKGVASYRAANPGSKLKTAVTTKPSKLKKGSKAANRRKSFCARMKGMKKRLTSAKTARDPDSRINKSLRKWNC